MNIQLGNILQIVLIISAIIVMVFLFQGNRDLKRASRELTQIKNELESTRDSVIEARMSIQAIRDSIVQAKNDLQLLRNEVEISYLEEQKSRIRNRNERNKFEERLERLREKRCAEFGLCD